jgi:hypothetical protein
VHGGDGVQAAPQRAHRRTCCYEEGSKTYRMFDPCAGKVVASQDVVFSEVAAWDWNDSRTG